MQHGDGESTELEEGTAEETERASADAAAELTVLSPRPIVAGVGASAGGIEALQAFFEAVPDDLGVAFVVVVHLSPEHRSQLASILASKTRMTVVQVTSTLELQGDHVYVIPPGQRLEITDSEVSAVPFDEPRGRRAPIDLFFRSLAAKHGDGFAVVLSGGGSDGAVGVKAIKEAGGVILVQDPREAAYDSMPRAAIATELADFVLPVRELATRLAELTMAKRRIREALKAEVTASLDAEDEGVLGRILAYLHARTGHDFSKYKRSTVLRRVGRRMQVHRTETLSGYLAYLRQNVEEAQALFDDLLITVTTFFRDPAAWTAVEKLVIPQLFEQKGAAEKLRVWIPGCATGEEAYSVAMLVIEEAERRDVWPEVQLFASDLDDGALATAREGRYPAAIAADVSDERLARFFRKEGDHYCVTKELRDCILFAPHSLLRDPPFSRLDFISCRNLLIYLDRELQAQVAEIFRYALRPSGFLFLGTSETVDGPHFSTVDKKHHILQLRESARVEARLPPLLLSTPIAHRPEEQERVNHGQLLPAPTAHRALLEQIGPPSILVDSSRRAIHLSETAGRYLQLPGGVPTDDVTQLVRPELQVELRAALFRAFEKGEGCLSPFVSVHFDGAPRRVAMLVRPRQVRGEALALVVFVEDSERAPVGENQIPGDSTSAETVRQLEAELRQTQERLRSSREEFETSSEELRAANEELQSINEEYRSTAEELETSREELQSINEELETVNNELKSKLEEVSRAHGDLENLMAATEIPTLFLDRWLRIQRFTPPLAELFSVTANDRGRPIADFTHRLDYEDLQSDARRVLDKLVPVEREVRGGTEQWFLVRMSPYRTLENKIDGVVATFVDVTEQKRAQEAVRRSQEEVEKELSAIARLHAMAMSITAVQSLSMALEEILAAAVDITNADFGSIQLLDKDAITLRTVAQRGFAREVVEEFQSESRGEGTAAARAIRSGRRVQISDVADDEDYAPYRSSAAKAGFRGVQATPLINTGGETLGVIATYCRAPLTLAVREERLLDLLGRHAADIIGGLRAEAEVKAVNRMLEERVVERGELLHAAEEARSEAEFANHAKSDFLATMSHELRTPLNAIIGYAELLEMGLPSAIPPNAQEQIQRIRLSAQLLMQLIEDVLAFSRIEAGREEVDMVPMALDPVFQEVAAIAEPLANRKGLEFRIDADDAPETVISDPLKLRQILVNLVNNAIKFTERGEIMLAARSNEAYLVIEVRDTGIGITPDHQAHLFEPFWQADGGLARRAGGSGLGLSIARRYAEMMGGEIVVKSKLGDGSSFELRLPLGDTG